MDATKITLVVAGCVTIIGAFATATVGGGV